MRIFLARPVVLIPGALDEEGAVGFDLRAGRRVNPRRAHGGIPQRHRHYRIQANMEPVDITVSIGRKGVVHLGFQQRHHLSHRLLRRAACLINRRQVLATLRLSRRGHTCLHTFQIPGLQNIRG